MPPITEDQRTLENARVLGICYYVWGGLNLCGGILSGGIAITMNQLMRQRLAQKAPPDAELVMDILFGAGIAMAVIGLVGGLLNLTVASLYRQGRTSTLSTVMAALNCLSVPLGTILGVFSFIIGGQLKELRTDQHETLP